MNLRSASVFLACFAFAGCGGAEVKKEVVAKTYDAFGKGDEAFKKNDFAGALPLLTEAVEKAGLQADLLADAFRMKAVCEIETGKLEEAEKDIAQAEQGGVAAVYYHDAMGRLLQKKGDSAKAGEHFAKARQADRTYVAPSSGS